jgi:hypothetical protein
MRGQVPINSYLASLLDPEDKPGAKIPDLVNAPSGTFQLTADTVVTVITAGDGLSFEAFGNPFGANQWQTGTNVVAGAAYTYTPFSFTGTAGAIAIYAQVRVVSAILLAEFTGSTAADSGQVCGCLFFRGTPAPATFQALQGQPYSKTVPAREGLVVRYKPFDNLDMEFTNGTSVAQFPYMIVSTAGMAVGASMRFRYVVNFEGIPKTDTSTFVNAAPSPVNLNDLQGTSNYLGAQMLYDYVMPFTNYFSPYASTGMVTAASVGAAASYVNRHRLGVAGAGNMLPRFG